MFIDMPSATSNRTTKRSAIIDDDVWRRRIIHVLLESFNSIWYNYLMGQLIPTKTIDNLIITVKGIRTVVAHQTY
jgi:hypothetical protein